MTPQNSDSKELALVDSGSTTRFTAEHGQEIGMPSPQAINYMMSIANMLISSALIGKDMGLSKDQIQQLEKWGITGLELEKRQNLAIKANAMAKMLVGREFIPPIPPMAALREIDIVKNKVYVEYPHLVAQMEAKGYEVVDVERTHERAAIELRHATKQTRTFEFTIDDAKRAGLTKRGGYNGDSPSQYELRPRVMLYSKVISEAYRATGGRAGTYTPEEKREIIAEQIHELLEDGSAPVNGKKEENPYFVGTKPAGEPEITTRPNATVNPGGESTPAQLEPSAPVEHARTAEASSKASDLPAPAERAGNGAAGEPQTVSSNTSATPSRPDLASGVPSPAPLASVGAPAAVVSTSKVVPIRITDATDKIAKLLPDPKQRDKVLNHFLGGFFNVSNAKKITKSDPRLVPALAILSALADKYMTQLMADPHGAGLMATAGWRGLEKYMDKLAWPEDCRELARAIALERYADTGGGDLLEYLEDPVKAHQMPMHELRTFLQVLARTRQALLLKDAAAGSTMSELVASWGLNLETCAEAEILAKLQRTQVDEPEPEQPDNLFEMFQEGVEDEQ